MIPQIVYLLCALTSTVCAWMLFRGYRDSHSRLLLWSSLCFGFLALNNITLVMDLVIFPEIDFSAPLLRNLMGASAGSLLLFGLIWEVT